MTDDELDARLRSAQQQRRATSRPTADRPMSLDGAYEFQRAYLAKSISLGGQSLGAYKLSITSEGAQRALKTDAPTYGALLDDQLLESPAVVVLSELIAPVIEPEVVFRITETLSVGASKEELIAKSRLSGAIEVPDSRIEGWLGNPELTAVDVVADGSLAGRLVISPAHFDPSEVDLAHLSVHVQKDGSEVGVGQASAVLGDPYHAMAWFIGALATHGEALEAGVLVSSGTFCPPMPVEPGSYRADFDVLGAVTVSFV